MIHPAGVRLDEFTIVSKENYTVGQSIKTRLSQSETQFSISCGRFLLKKSYKIDGERNILNATRIARARLIDFLEKIVDNAKNGSSIVDKVALYSKNGSISGSIVLRFPCEKNHTFTIPIEDVFDTDAATVEACDFLCAIFGFIIQKLSLPESTPDFDLGLVEFHRELMMAAPR